MDAKTIAKLGSKLKLLTLSNPKVLKGGAGGYLTAILHLAPANESGFNTCAMHTKECAASCLYFAARGAMSKIQAARIRRTRMFFEQRAAFLSQLHADIQYITTVDVPSIPNCQTLIRLNGTSDIKWETLGVPQAFPTTQFYDYTKLTNRRNLPPNYSLVFSFSGSNLNACLTSLFNGVNVAVPFLKMPAMWQGYPVINGDEDDLRFLDATPCVVGLRAKGRLRKDPQSLFLGDNHP